MHSSALVHALIVLLRCLVKGLLQNVVFSISDVDDDDLVGVLRVFCNDNDEDFSQPTLSSTGELRCLVNGDETFMALLVHILLVCYMNRTVSS